MNQEQANIAKSMAPTQREKIQATWTSNCRIYMTLNGAPEQAKVLMVRSLKDLEKFASFANLLYVSVSCVFTKVFLFYVIFCLLPSQKNDLKLPT